ncbi:MAG TPA: glycosyltransferase [Candidatus Hydrogenedentes bacterium]|jgi:undecaprenyl-phosphate 4-deoxy-4-formamido-L-arabinose transferase|nr:MAG: Undecaprenyl-phosphate 4-deoxy-4-formamido-L-arabinose transferase [Candidatus Hydrogenedentes bacterium ADurb.Bin170]HNZ49768.1 glycosyltransferase [Candidatus Hydrogenedentota bacterium]HOD95865.1 glycosyltransferase [Candidatus Hydrogenedentota bacterium]HOH43214.1 glycosyltransferase [Candidatus Hydrogenedentota bacterium]HOR49680.1 glycosyltransferase [Candidatus Hydrogenedentota bacterium]
MSEDTLKISVVIPIFNEERSLAELYERITATLEQMGQPYEVIAVNDGSTDSSVDILKDIRKKDPRWRILLLSRNFGQSPALYAGFSQAQGDYVFMLDADLQVYPEDIPILYEKLEAGYDMVGGWRVNRHDNPFRKIMSRFLNRYTGHATGFPLHDHGCSLKGFRRQLVKHMTEFSHRCRYLPVDAAMLGGKVTEVKVRHARRQYGSSRYSLVKLFRTGFDLITTVTILPLQTIGVLGVLSAGAGVLLTLHGIISGLMNDNVSQLEIILAAFLFFGGVHLCALGIVCEYVGRIYIETQRKPLFIIQEEVE